MSVAPAAEISLAPTFQKAVAPTIKGRTFLRAAPSPSAGAFVGSATATLTSAPVRGDSSDFSFFFSFLFFSFFFKAVKETKKISDDCTHPLFFFRVWWRRRRLPRRRWSGAHGRVDIKKSTPQLCYLIFGLVNLNMNFFVFLMSMSLNNNIST